MYETKRLSSIDMFYQDSDEFFIYYPSGDIKQLSSEDLLLSSLGSKGHRLAHLKQLSFPVPRCLILPTFVLDQHLQASPSIENSLGENNKTSTSGDIESQANPLVFKTSLMGPVRTAVSWFVNLLKGAPVAVRSSAITEDTPEFTNAGKYITCLNCRGEDAVERGILKSWSSLEIDREQEGKIRASSQMAILLMEMVDAQSSGVLFTQNPLSGGTEYVIEAVRGQCAGLTSGDINPDRFVLNETFVLKSAQHSNCTVQYVLPTTSGPPVKVTIPVRERENPVLTEKQVTLLCHTAQKISQHFAKPQDIEWAFDKSGHLQLLQTRDITAVSGGLPAFLPPGAGSWRVIDHIERPGTRCFAEYYYKPMEDGWNEDAERVGTNVHVNIHEVNGFMYYQMEVCNDSNYLREREDQASRFWNNTLYFDSLENWDKKTKPSVEKELGHLQKIKLKELSNTDLAQHIRHLIEVTKRMVFNHHALTYTSFVPLGDFIVKTLQWSRIDELEILSLLSSSDRTQLTLNPNNHQISEMLDALSADIEARCLINQAEEDPRQAASVLEKLIKRNSSIANGLQYLFDRFAFRIISGYDITSETFAERPDFLLKVINAMLRHSLLADNSLDIEIDRIRNRVPPDKQVAFVNMLSAVRKMERLRDERGMFTDLWAVGILRHAYLEAGERLHEAGMIPDSHLILDASVSEIIAFLNESSAVSVTDLCKRRDFRMQWEVSDAPPVLGSETMDKEDLSSLPPNIARSMKGLMTAVAYAVDSPAHEAASDNILRGVAASSGSIEGVARVVRESTDLHDLRPGEILIIRQATTVLNGIMPLVGALVCEYGGILSHPAILAREFKLPCVVGCKEAMTSVTTGMRIRVDGTNGQVILLNQSSTQLKRNLQELVCSYDGPLRGRNRDRVLNHLDAVKNRLEFMKSISETPGCPEVLQRHFYGEISSDQAIRLLGNLLKDQEASFPLEKFYSSLSFFISRYHTEFHPTDICNLQCSGCTYHHDTLPNVPSASFPFEGLDKLLSIFQPNAVTIVGGGEPVLYQVNNRDFSDIVRIFSRNDVDLGIITNGTVWPKNDAFKSKKIKWLRFSVDAAESTSYLFGKRKDLFGNVTKNLLRVLKETNIPQVGIGFLYHSGNIISAPAAIIYFKHLLEQHCPTEISRFNIQFRPWRAPTGSSSISEHIITQSDVESTYNHLENFAKKDDSLKDFIHKHTNLAVNLLCRGARENIKPFTNCLFGLAKVVVRADGSLYPCFRVAANQSIDFCFGNILHDSPQKISLNALHVLSSNIEKFCTSKYDRCLFCVFNNLLENGIKMEDQALSNISGDYFF